MFDVCRSAHKRPELYSSKHEQVSNATPTETRHSAYDEIALATTMTSSTGVTRTPTIPLTKRDSLAVNGSRVSLISNGSANHSNSNTQTNNRTSHVSTNSSRPKMKEFKDSDFVNSNPDMVSGKKRTNKKVKRTDSYKLALNRQSGLDDLDKELPSEKSAKHKRDKGSRTKYHTLPIKIEERVKETLALPSDAKRKKHSDHNDNTDSNNFERNASQKSGTFPSPDTDEDQSTTQPDRKKKSAFKRMKERLIQTFRKDSHKDHKTKHRNSRAPRVRHRTVSGDRVRPNQDGGARGFQTPNSGEERMEIDEEHSPKGRTIFQSIRSSFRKKNRPDKYTNREPSQPSQTGARVDRHPSHPIDIPSSTQTAQHPTTDHIADDPIEPNDSISEIFGSLIDPSAPYFPASCPAPDRTKLRLEGLKKFRPKSFENKDTGGSESGRTAVYRGSRTIRAGDLSPTVEIDGLDYADAPTRPDTGFQSESDEGNQAYHLVSETEQQRRIDDVSRRLRAIGDRVAAEKESESATSSSEAAGGRRLSEFEQQILSDLRRFADTKNHELKNEGGVNIYLVPIIKQLLRAHSYPEFKNIVQREVGHTMGWDQVAWYTYLMQTTMCVMSTGKNVGSMVKDHATRYFNSNIRPFIRARPNGWESIYEETDVDDSELD